MKNVLILDLETTGLDPHQDRVVEIGFVVYSVEYHSTIAQASTVLCHPEGNPAEPINGIPSAMIADNYIGFPTLVAEDLLSVASMECQAIVAHNACFDRSFMDVATLDRLPWICTFEDFEWPVESARGKSLVQVAVAHGVAVTSAHRALTDCQLIAAAFDRIPDLAKRLERAMLPKVTYKALVSYDDRDKAKAAGFRWDGGRREWLKRFPEGEVPELPFRVAEVKP